MKKFLTFMLAGLFCCLALGCGDEETSVIDGTLVAYDEDSLEITVDNTTNYLFALEDAKVEGDDPVPGNLARVEYKGKLDNGSLEQKVEVTSVTFSGLGIYTDKGLQPQPEENQVPDTENDEDPVTETPTDSTGDSGGTNGEAGGENTVQGSVTEITMETLGLETSGGVYTFNIEATGTAGDDINIGDSVTITYDGELEAEGEIMALTLEKQ